MNANQSCVLLKTSTATSAIDSAGILTVAGTSVRKSEIKSFRQFKSKAEVKQVITIANNSYTPTASTTYIVKIFSPQRRYASVAQQPEAFSFTTNADLTTYGATAALQREAITAGLVAAINAGYSAYVTAASLLLGTGFTLTDVGPYYGPRTQGGFTFFGANQVELALDQNGLGFPDTAAVAAGSTGYRVITTPAVYSSGVGADILNQKPIVDQMYGRVLSGMTTGQAIYNPPAPTNADAVSGQNYDLFTIEWLKHAEVYNQTARIAFQEAQTYIYVDNGTGSSTANLTGFIATERTLLRNLFWIYRSDTSAVYDFFDQALIASATYPTTGAAITTTDNVVMAVESTSGANANTWYVNPIGTHTLLTPLVTTSGLQLLLDVVDEEGIEFSVPNITQCPKEFVVGQQEYSFYARVSSANYAHLEEFAFGLRKKAAYAVNLVAYDAASADFAALGVVSEAVNGLIKAQTSKAAGGVVAGTTAATWTSGAHDMLITVDINGAVRFFLDSVEVTNTQTTAYTFTAGTHLMPFIDTTLDANVDAAPLLIQTAALPNITWRA